MARIVAHACVLAFAFAGPALGQTDEQVEARLTPTVHACENAPNNGGAFSQAICYRDEAARQDQSLNTTWAQLIDKLPPSRREALRRSERQWIKQRDQHCRDEAAAYANSTAAYMFNVCMANEAIRRTIWLESAR